MFHTLISHYPRARRLVCSLLIFCFVFALSGCGSSSSDAPKPSPSPTPIETGDGGSYGMWVLEGLLKGLSSYVAGQSLGWLLSLLKGGGSTDSDAFKTMNQKMNDIIGDLKTIEATLDRVLGLINLKADQIIEQDAYYNMKGNIDTISTDYDNYLWTLSNAPTKENAASQAMAYIDADNMEFQIEEIYTGIMGTTPGIDAGALYESTTLILDQQTGIDATQLLNSYLSLETIFIQLVEYQLQGAALEVEGLHWRDNPWVGTLNQKDSDGVGSAVGSEFPGTAEEFMTSWFQPKLDDEVEEFLRCVDRIVCSQLDLRTDITTTSQTVDGFLPSTAEQIYFRADFIAAQFSSRHQFGVNVRLVGEPTTIEAIAWGGSANVQFQDGFGFTANMTLVPLGLTTSPGYPVRYNPVEKMVELAHRLR